MQQLSVFFSQAFIRYQNESEANERDEMCLEIKRDLKTFPGMLEESEDGIQHGRFSAKKLNGLSNETLNSYLNVGGDHSYNVIVENTENEKTWIFGNEDRNPGNSDDMSSYQTPILLVAGEEQPSVGRLRVMVW